MKEKQFYIDRAESCLKGIEIIKAEITKYKSVKKRREMAEKYAQDIAILEKEYRVNRSAYDVLFFALSISVMTGIQTMTITLFQRC